MIRGSECAPSCVRSSSPSSVVENGTCTSSSSSSRTTRGPSRARKRTASSFESPAPARITSSISFAGESPSPWSMIPPCAQNVLQSFGSADFVTRRTLIPAVARQSAVVSPAMPVPMTRTGQCSRFFSAGTRRVFYLRGGLREARDHVRPALDVALDLDDVVALRVFQQVAERVVAVVLLVERRLLALHGLLDHRSPEDLLVLAHQRLDRVDQKLEHLGLLLVLERHRRRLRHAAHEVLVEDELVAVVDQQGARGVLHPDADDVLVVLLQLRDERGEIGVA